MSTRRNPSQNKAYILSEVIMLPVLVAIIIGGVIATYIATGEIFTRLQSDSMRQVELSGTLTFISQRVKEASFIVPIDGVEDPLTRIISTNTIDIHYHANPNVSRLRFVPDTQSTIGQGQFLFFPDIINTPDVSDTITDNMVIAPGSFLFGFRPEHGKPHLEIAFARVESTKYRSVDINFSIISPAGNIANFQTQASTPQEFFLIYVDNGAVGFQDGSFSNPYRTLDDALSVSTEFEFLRNVDWAGDYIIVRTGNYTLGPGNINITCRGILFQQGTSLTIQPGTTLNMGRQADIIIRNGRFTANGTPVNPIIIRALHRDSFPSQPSFDIRGIPIVTNRENQDLALTNFLQNIRDYLNNDDLVLNMWGKIFLFGVNPANTAQQNISNVTFEHGRRALAVNDSPVDIENCTFRDNFSNNRFANLGGDNYITRSGGALSIRGDGHQANIDNILFERNVSFHGGAIGLDTSRAQITNCTFRQNQAANGGGAVFLRLHNNWTRRAEITRCLFEDNIIHGTAAEHWGGGAIAMTSCANRTNTNPAFNFGVLIKNCIFNSNYSGTHRNEYNPARPQPFFGGRGGAIRTQHEGTVENCTFFNNRASVGGAIGVVRAAASAPNGPDIRNNIFWSNQAFRQWVGNPVGNEVFLQDDNISFDCINWCDLQGGLLLDNQGVYRPNNLFLRTPWTEGTGNIDADPLFNNISAGDFSLQPGSPCTGSGEGGVDMGAWGGIPLPATIGQQ
jgi:hypothetical protein